LESGDTMSAEFKKIAAFEIAEFKAEYATRFPGRDAESLTDEDLLREVMNTVGKPGKLGEHVRCVVSVSMLTEGWDANTVTHILGVRAFGTQLLCEQVVGRGLRRMSYAVDETTGHFTPEYAEIYGIPFSFIPASGTGPDPKPATPTTRVRALEERTACEIYFPIVVGYRWDFPEEHLAADFGDDSRLALDSTYLPTTTEVSGSVGEREFHSLDDLKAIRPQAIAFNLAKRLLDRYFRDAPDESGVAVERPWLFPKLARIAGQWMNDPDCLILKDNAFPQLLAFAEYANDAADRIYLGIVRNQGGEKRLRPMLRAWDPVGSTRYVDFDTARPCWATNPEKCHVTHVAADTDSWEQRMAQALEEMPEVVRYVKNQSLGFTIPYTLDGEGHAYIPDFLACVDDGHGPSDLLNVVVEVTGKKDKAKAAKTATARELWVPAVNNHGGFGRWAFVEVTDPWDAHDTIRGIIQSLAEALVGEA
jgi:type III restriction enzyme